MKSKNLAIIPARAGSKGIKNKNLKKVGSRTLIEHAITAGQNSTLIDDIIVTSDHSAIISIAKTLGVHTRNRPPQMSTDESLVVDCLQDAVLSIEKHNYIKYDNIILLQATSPIRTGYDIDSVITIMDNNPNIEGVISVCESGVHHPSHQYFIEHNEELNMDLMMAYDPSGERERRQDVRDTYVRNGALYTARRSKLMDEGKMIVDVPVPYVMPKRYWCNIDTPDDLLLAELIVPAWESNLI